MRARWHNGNHQSVFPQYISCCDGIILMFEIKYKYKFF